MVYVNELAKLVSNIDGFSTLEKRLVEALSGNACEFNRRYGVNVGKELLGGNYSLIKGKLVDLRLLNNITDGFELLKKNHDGLIGLLDAYSVEDFMELNGLYNDEVVANIFSNKELKDCVYDYLSESGRKPSVKEFINGLRADALYVRKDLSMSVEVLPNQLSPEVKDALAESAFYNEVVVQVIPLIPGVFNLSLVNDAANYVIANLPKEGHNPNIINDLVNKYLSEKN